MERIACLPSPPVPATLQNDVTILKSCDDPPTSPLTTSDEPDLRGKVPNAGFRFVLAVLHLKNACRELLEGRAGNVRSVSE